MFPLRASVGPTVDTQGHVGVEARGSVGVGFGGPRSTLFEELSIGGGYGLGLGRYVVVSASVGYHHMLGRRLGLRVSGGGGGGFPAADGVEPLVGGGAAFGLQGRLYNYFGHGLLLGGDLRLDVLGQGQAPIRVALSLPLTLELRLQAPHGHWHEELVTPWFRLRTSSSRSLIPHALSIGALPDEAWTRHGGRWVPVAEEDVDRPGPVRRRFSARPYGDAVLLDRGDRVERYLPGQLRPVEVR